MSKLSKALDNLECLQNEYDTVYTDTVDLIKAVRGEHEEHAHTGPFRWCDRPACALANELDPRYPR